MAFDKEIPSTVSEYKVYDVHSTEELIKVASSDVDLPDGFEFDPDYFYLWIRIISSGEFYGPNKNGDYFPTEELLSSYETFNDAHVFKNHENKKIEKAIGRIFSVRWNPIMKCVEIFKGIDRKLAPEIVRGFEKGFLTDVSMGCKVPYTVCSVCGNKARRRDEFCSHVKTYRMQFLGNGERVFEINYEPKFHDSSVVLNGAERVAKALVIFNQPKENANVESFRKVASSNGVSSFTKLADIEMEKVAFHKEEVIHPLLRAPLFEKVASDNPYLVKIAELEKEVTGKLLNIVSAPTESKPKSAEQLIQIIKFLTEERMDENSLKSVAKMLCSISKAEKISVSKAFSAFISVAELMGIELFPTELHTILCEMTSAKLEKSLELSETKETELYPTEFAKGVKQTLEATEQLPSFDDTSNIFNTYNEVPFFMDEFKSSPFDFLNKMKDGAHDLDEESPLNVIKIIRETLEPLMAARSRHPEHLLPRLSIVLGGHQSIMGGAEAKRDIEVMSAPKTLGDLMATIAYTNYQHMRPQIMFTKLAKTARYFDGELEKVASEKPYKGVKKRHLALTAVPAIYGASAFANSKRDNGKELSDTENFFAENPGVISAGTLLAGKPLSAQLVKGSKAAGKGLKNVAEGTEKRMKEGFNKLTSEEYTELVKVADSLGHGQFNAFDGTMMERFASQYRLDAQDTALIKMASLLEIGGMSNEASSILESKQIPSQATGEFLKFASEYTSDEMTKAAGDFVNSLVLDGVIDKRNFTTTAHGRVLDAMVFKKLGDIGKPKAPKVEQGVEEIV